jgi:predicted nucleic acid-binding protein
VTFGAILDTSVLFPQLLRDMLLRVASHGLYRPLWSPDILRELGEKLHDSYPDRPPDAGRIFELMREAFPEAEIEGYATLQAAIALPDPADRHVVAAAVRGGADVIVTNNLRDFPADVLGPLGLDAQSPDAFLLERFHERPDLVMAALREQVSAYRRPPVTVGDLISALDDRHGLQAFASSARAWLRSP